MELNLTKLRVLTRYDKQYRCKIGIAGYLRGHISEALKYCKLVLNILSLPYFVTLLLTVL